MCIKRLFWPHYEVKKSKFQIKSNKKSQVSSYKFIRTKAKVLSSGIDSTFMVAMVTKMAAKIG